MPLIRYRLGQFFRVRVPGISQERNVRLCQRKVGYGFQYGTKATFSNSVLNEFLKCVSVVRENRALVINALEVTRFREVHTGLPFSKAILRGNELSYLPF